MKSSIASSARSAAHPREFDGISALYEKALTVASGTPLVDEIMAELQRLLRMRHEALSADLAALDERVRAAVEKFDILGAREALEKERDRHSLDNWPQLIDRRLRELRAQADQQLVTLKIKALEAKAKGAQNEARGIIDTVAAWKIPELSQDLGTALANPVTPPPAAPPPVIVPPPAEPSGPSMRPSSPRRGRNSRRKPRATSK